MLASRCSVHSQSAELKAPTSLHLYRRRACPPFLFLKARGNGKNHRHYKPTTGRACALPLRGFIMTVIFSATDFLVARARIAVPPTYATLLWLFQVELPISAAPLRSSTRQIGLRKMFQQRFGQSLRGLGAAGSSPESLIKVLANIFG